MEQTKLQKVILGVAVSATALGQAGLVAVPVIGPILAVTNILSAVLPPFFKKKKKPINIDTPGGGQ